MSFTILCGNKSFSFQKTEEEREKRKKILERRRLANLERLNNIRKRKGLEPLPLTDESTKGLVFLCSLTYGSFHWENYPCKVSWLWSLRQVLQISSRDDLREIKFAVKLPTSLPFLVEDFGFSNCRAELSAHIKSFRMCMTSASWLFFCIAMLLGIFGTAVYTSLKVLRKLPHFTPDYILFRSRE